MALAWGTNDLPYYAYRTLIAAVLEENIGLMCAFLLGCRPITREVKKWFGQSISQDSGLGGSPSEVDEYKEDPERRDRVRSGRSGNGVLNPEPVGNIRRYWERNANDEQETRGRSRGRTR